VPVATGAAMQELVQTLPYPRVPLIQEPRPAPTAMTAAATTTASAGVRDGFVGAAAAASGCAASRLTGAAALAAIAPAAVMIVGSECPIGVAAATAQSCRCRGTDRVGKLLRGLEALSARLTSALRTDRVHRGRQLNV